MKYSYEQLRKDIIDYFQGWGDEFVIYSDDIELCDFTEEQVLDLLLLAKESKKKENIIWIDRYDLSTELTVTEYFWDIRNKYRLLLE